MIQSVTNLAAQNAASGARRRYVTLLFADLSESTRIAAALEAEVYAEMLAELRQAAEEIVARHGGAIVQFLGDGVVAIFGYPVTREDDGRRATEAAIELHERIAGIRLETPLPWRAALGMHSGIHAGLVLVNEGDRVRGALQLIGDIPNIAARLSDAAEDGQIVVSAETLGPESNFFRTEGPFALRIAGRDAPLAAYRVLGRASAGTRFEAGARRGLSAFIGRQAELGLLEEALQEAAAGRPIRAVIVAPAGTGKTRMAEEFLRRARGMEWRVCRGYCESYLSAQPMQPFVQMLRSVFGIDPAMAPAAASAKLEAELERIGAELVPRRGLLLQALSLGAGTGAEERRAAPEAVIAAIRDLFERLAAARPLVLFIDDWQWSDHATRLVSGALQGIGGLPILHLFATREIEAGDASLDDARIVRLAPFSDDEAKETIQGLLPGVDPFVAREIRRHSGGNPLFLEELCHSARLEASAGRQTLQPTGGAWLDSLIESRVARLPPEQAELVRTAAVIGNIIPSWLLRALTGYGEDHPIVQSLAAQDFVYPTAGAGTLRFKHGLARDAIYAAVGLRERRTLHARIAGALRDASEGGTRDDMFEPLAYHYRAAGNAGEAARFAELAGDKALAAYALDQAQAQYRVALDALDQLPASQEVYARWSAIAKRLASACVFDPAREQLAVFARAVSLALAHDDARAAANAEYWLGYIHYALGEAATAIRHFESAQARIDERLDAPLAAQLIATLGQAKSAACQYDAALALFDQALSIKREHRAAAKPSVGSAYTLACKAAVLGDLGHFAEAESCFGEALSALQGVHHVVEGSVLCLQSSVLLWQGRWDDARRAAASAERVARRVKSLYFLAMSRSLGGYADWVLGRAPEALQRIADATSWLEARNRGLFISLNHGWLTEGFVAAGDDARGRRHAVRALQRARRGDHLGEAMTWRALARAGTAARGRRTPQACLARALRAAKARGSPHEVAVTQLCSAEFALARGARSEAVSLLEQASREFERMQMAWHLAQAEALSKKV